MRMNWGQTPVLILVALLPCAAAAEQRQASVASLDRARALLHEGDAEHAAELFAELAAADTADAESRAGRVRSLLALDRWRDAVAEARGFADEMPSSAVVAAALGEALFRAGRFEETDALLSPVVASLREPDGSGVADRAMAHALVVLGRLRTAEGQDPLAARYLNHALQLAPEDRWVLYWSAGAGADRSEIVSRLERYLELSRGDDADRIEAARGKIEFYGVLGERRVWVVENRPDRVEVPLIPIDNGAGGVIGYAVDVRIGAKKPVRLMLDSGSTGLFVLARIAKKRGFEAMAEETVFGGGGKKRHVSPRGLFPEVDIGGLRFSDALATTTRHEIDPTGRFHGLIGLSLFRGYRIVLELDVVGRAGLTYDD